MKIIGFFCLKIEYIYYFFHSLICRSGESNLLKFLNSFY
jgi:hypothetical protein